MDVFLETDRLLLRRFTEADADLLVELDSDPEVMRYLTGGKPTPREKIENETLPRLLEHYQRFGGLGLWPAFTRSGGEFIGWFLLRPVEDEPGSVELGYRLRRAAWGHGYATEGSIALVDKGFAEFGIERIVGWTMAVNTRSRRVLEKTGLRLVRICQDDRWERIEGSEHGEAEYEVLPTEWVRPSPN